MAAETLRIEIPIDVEDNTEPGVSSAKRKVKSFDDVNRKIQERLDKMNRTKYRVVLDALDRASSVIGAVRSKVGGFAGRTFSFTLKVLDVATAPLRGVFEPGNINPGCRARGNGGICWHLPADEPGRRL